MKRDAECVFCRRIGDEATIAENDLAAAFFDAYPVSSGHVLVVPRRHEPDYFALDADERSELWNLVDRVRGELDGRFGPQAYNIGVNAGEAAGQTVPHAHIHLIPRYRGDVEDPRGGVRHVIPGKAAWWTDSEDEPVK